MSKQKWLITGGAGYIGTQIADLFIEAGKDVVAFERPGDFACYINFGAPIQLPSNSQILIASGPVTGHTLPTDTAVWVRLVP